MSLDLSMDTAATSDPETPTGLLYGLSPGADQANQAGDALHRGQPRDWTYWPRGIVRWIVWTLTAPLRAYLSLRRSMTVASVAMLLGAFMTLNVIWGFPWSGMMGGCLATLIVGFAINRVMGPRLKLSVSLPRSAVARNPFSVNVRLTNPRKLPALSLRVGWHREGLQDLYRKKTVRQWEASPPVSVDMLRSGDQMQWHGAMRFDQRGLHELPPFQVASTFPFHLFHYRTEIGTGTQIAITPAPASVDDDETTRVMLATIGDWANQLVAGAPVEYVGNREYQEGIPVRRWDFASWARLGRPIVREYQSPSIQSVTLIVDTSQPGTNDKPTPRAAAKRRRLESEQAFERLLSIVASAIAEISSRRVQLKLYLTSESMGDAPIQPVSAQVNEGNERLLVRLAVAEPVDPILGGQRIREAIESNRSQPALLFSLLEANDDDRRDLVNSLPAHVTYLPILARRRNDSRVGGARVQ